jgi:hypothetical protein
MIYSSLYNRDSSSLDEMDIRFIPMVCITAVLATKRSGSRSPTTGGGDITRLPKGRVGESMGGSVPLPEGGYGGLP